MHRSLFVAFAVGFCSAVSAFSQGAYKGSDHTISARLRISPSDDGRADPIALPLPAYPQKMLGAGIGGEATVKFLVREDGTVSDVSIIASTQSEFGDPTREAAAHWRFTPPKHRRTQAPVKLWMTCRVIFKFDEE